MRQPQRARSRQARQPLTRAKWQTLLDRVLAHPVKVGTQTFTYADTATSVPLGNVDEWRAGESCCN